MQQQQQQQQYFGDAYMMQQQQQQQQLVVAQPYPQVQGGVILNPSYGVQNQAFSSQTNLNMGVVITQPTPAPAYTTLDKQQPVNVLIVDTSASERDWNSGICDCCRDCKSCCLTLFCNYCVMSCWLSGRMGEHCCTPILVFEAAEAYRMKLRTRYNIKGSAVEDCCCTCCCYHLVVCQMLRELDYIEKNVKNPAF